MTARIARGIAAAAIAFAACSIAGVPAVARAADPWPKVTSLVRRDAALEARVDRLLAGMSLEEKVAQVIQPDIASITPQEVRRYKFGSILNGGNSSPGGRETAPATEWLKLADSFWAAAMGADWAKTPIPLLWGSDAVHGHSNVVGATIFPHNIGLGATRNPALIRRIGEVTALEMRVTGLDWDFSPTLAVVRDDRWGRTYEGFSEDPEIVRQYAGAMVEGLQGKAGTRRFLGPGKVIATAKHFVGDGGTDGGKDQGDNPSPPGRLAAIHGAGYPPAIRAGVQSVMASFSSVRGTKVTGDPELLTRVLKQRMGFDGILVGDWNAHGQVPGCSNVSCPAAFNAGLDMFMAPDSWKGLYENLLRQARSGEIPAARLDDAVRRILRVKLRAGLFDQPRPSARPFAGNFALLGSPAHRAVARQAVRESLVLLKNQGRILPLHPRSRVLVAGDGADNIAKQSGGWTLSWQGTGTTNADFPNGQSIFAGIRDSVAAAGGSAALSTEGIFTDKPDVAIVVFGEDPYAEFVGDRATLEYSPSDKKDLALLRRLKAAGIPVVSVFLSGRPLWVNPELNASDAFIAAFLPGTEGAGVADLLFRDSSGRVRHDFKGRLSFSWPRRGDQTPLNRGDPGYDPLFAYGHGLSLRDSGSLPLLSEEPPPAVLRSATDALFGRAGFPAGWSLEIPEGGALSIANADRRAQEDARRFRWDGSGEARARLLAAQPLDLSREATGELSLVVDYRLDRPPTAAVLLGMDSARVPIAGLLRAGPAGQWTSLTVPLRCLTRAGLDPRRVSAPFVLSTAGALDVTISDIRIASAAVPQDSCGAP